jgi:hypothetical protein
MAYGRHIRAECRETMKNDRQRFGRDTGFVALLATMLACAACAGAEFQERLPGDDLFKEECIPKIRIEIPPASLDQLRQHPKTYVSGIVREGNVTYNDVAIRLKGGPGSFRPVDDAKPAFTLNFGRTVKGRRFHGLKKLHLNNSVQDHTYLSEKICRELFEAAGVPAPRAGHAAVNFNGRDLGLFVLVEGIDKHFLRRYFKDDGGILYDGHSQSDVTSVMRTNSGEERRDGDGRDGSCLGEQRVDRGGTYWAGLCRRLSPGRWAVTGTNRATPGANGRKVIAARPVGCGPRRLVWGWQP